MKQSEDGQLAWNGGGNAVRPNFFNKVFRFNYTAIPSADEKGMDDIAKGLKIAGYHKWYGDQAAKISRIPYRLHKNLGQGIKQNGPPSPPVEASQPVPTAQPTPAPPSPSYTPSVAASRAKYRKHLHKQREQQEAIFCDQCGARVGLASASRNNLGAQLP